MHIKLKYTCASYAQPQKPSRIHNIVFKYICTHVTQVLLYLNFTRESFHMRNRKHTCLREWLRNFLRMCTSMQVTTHQENNNNILPCSSPRCRRLYWQIVSSRRRQKLKSYFHSDAEMSRRNVATVQATWQNHELINIHICEHENTCLHPHHIRWWNCVSLILVSLSSNIITI